MVMCLEYHGMIYIKIQINVLIKLHTMKIQASGR